MIFRLFSKRRRAQLSRDRWHALATAAEAEADRANAELERRLRRGETRRWPETPAADRHLGDATLRPDETDATGAMTMGGWTWPSRATTRQLRLRTMSAQRGATDCPRTTS